MCTYGRYEIVRQSLTMFLTQDYENKQLVIFNTAPTPLSLDANLLRRGDIKVVNQTSKADGSPFTCLGDVRNASLDHAEGDLYICWDDDDLFLPWHISQAVQEYCECDELAWKPDVSYMSMDGGDTFRGLAGNSMEASFVVDMQHIKSLGFSTNKSGAEHVDGGWLSQTQISFKDISPFESYGYVWGDNRAAHKTSGHINAENNFENHKDASQDFGTAPLSPVPLTSLEKFFKSAVAVWENQDRHEMCNHSASRSQVEALKSKIRNVYEKYLLQPPEEFLPSVVVTESEKPVTGRNDSFTKVISILREAYDRPITIVETGCIRKPTDEGRYGDGWSTLNWDYYSKDTGSQVHVVDINADHLAASKTIVPESDRLKYHLGDSVEFLRSFHGKIDFLFLDSYDYCGDDKNMRLCHYHSLNEVMVSWDKLNDRCFILLDDVFDSEWNGKGKLSIPFLLDKGFELVYHVDNQVLLQRK